MHTRTIQKIQKAYIKTYEEDVKIYKDIENSQGQGAFLFENTGMTIFSLNKIEGFLLFTPEHNCLVRLDVHFSEHPCKIRKHWIPLNQTV